MKNIVICCDGTSNDFGGRPSNVVHLFSVLKKDLDRQLVYYDPGVGTPSTYDSFNPITKRLKYIFGQSFGYGLSENIMEAYKFLMQTYEEGDQLYFFGFSRGAYTVRALAGLINTCGLFYPNSENLVPEAMRIYSNRKFTQPIPDPTGKKATATVASNFKKIFGRKIDIHFLGLWDTVSSVGWVYNPVTLQATSNNESVKNVRHAISLDERRAFFRQNLWGRQFEKKQDIKQVWFAGVHADVGGSYAPERSALSNIALEWMLLEAREKGLLIDEAEARELIKGVGFTHPHLEPLNKSLTGFWYLGEIWMKIIRKNLMAREQIEAARENRPVPASKWVSRPYFNLARYREMYDYERYTLHESVVQRLQELRQYRPKNVVKICSDMKAIPEHFNVEKWMRL